MKPNEDIYSEWGFIPESWDYELPVWDIDPLDSWEFQPIIWENDQDSWEIDPKEWEIDLFKW